MKKKTLIFLDDYRDPFDSKIDWMVFSPIGRNVTIVWVKSYDEFVAWITENGLPDAITFDHDLSDEHYAPQSEWETYDEWFKKQNFTEKTGYDCAIWLTEYCMDNNESLPIFASHSANPVGREKIRRLLTNFLKIRN